MIAERIGSKQKTVGKILFVPYVPMWYKKIVSARLYVLTFPFSDNHLNQCYLRSKLLLFFLLLVRLAVFVLAASFFVFMEFPALVLFPFRRSSPFRAFSKLFG